MAKPKKEPERKPFRVAIDETDKSVLTHAGVTGMVYVQKPFDLNEEVMLIETTTVTGRPKIVKRDKQLDQFETLMGNPLAVPYTLCINSVGTDLRSKYVAAFILRRAIALHKKRQYSTLGLSPEWHILTGSYADSRRDKAYELRKKPKPSLIVFSNINADCSEVKKEKLRDLLELYADVPRVVAITGMDPFTFFNEKLHYKLNVGLHIARGSGVDPMRRRGVPKLREARDNITDEKPPKRQSVTTRTSEI